MVQCQADWGSYWSKGQTICWAAWNTSFWTFKVIKWLAWFLQTATHAEKILVSWWSHICWSAWHQSGKTEAAKNHVAVLKSGYLQNGQNWPNLLYTTQSRASFHAKLHMKGDKTCLTFVFCANSDGSDQRPSHYWSCSETLMFWEKRRTEPWIWLQLGTSKVN